MGIISTFFIKIYSLFAILLLVLIVLFYSIFLFFFEFTHKNKEIISRKTYILIFKIWYFLIGIKHTEINSNEVNKNTQCIYIANHSSYMDIPPIILMNIKNLKILGKNELTKYWILGWLYKKIVVVVNRKSIQNRAKSYNNLQECIDNKNSIFIFPEGTFNESNNLLKNFYNGAFNLAIENNIPIQPVLFIHAHKRLHYRSILNLTPGLNSVVFLSKIDVSNYAKKDTIVLKNHVYNYMLQELSKWS